MISFIKEQRNKYPKICEIIRFLVVGGFATIIDMFIMGIVLYIFNQELYNNSFTNVFIMGGQVSSVLVVLATAIGFIVGLVFNYIFSIVYVYDGNYLCAKTKKGFIIFAILSSIGLGIQSLGMFIGYSLIGLNEWIVKVVLVFVVLVFNYISRKLFVFNKNLEADSVSMESIQKKDETSQIKTTKLACILNIIFIISSFALSLLMFNPTTFNAPISWAKYLKYLYAVCAAILVSIYLFFINKNVLTKVKLKNNAVKIIFAVIYTLGLSSILLETTSCHGVLKIALTLASLFCLFFYSYCFVEYASRFIVWFWGKLNQNYKKLMIFLSAVGIFFCLICYCITTVFTEAGWFYDRFFSFDTGTLLYFKYHINQVGPENDLRHFFMSLSILPFSVIPEIFSKMFYSIPAFTGLLLSFIQVILVVYCIILILQMLQIQKKSMMIIFASLLMACSGTLYNMITAEKFIFSLFYIITTIYMTLNHSSSKWLFFLGAVGSLTTNIFLFPLVVFLDKKPMKEWVAEVVLFAIIFIGLLMITGQTNVLLFSKYSWDSMKEFSSVETKLPFSNILLQTLIFVSTTILSPNTLFAERIAQADPSLNFLAILGAIILILNVVSFILNFRNKYAQACFYWQLFMLFLLLIVGWGSARNEMFIYSSIFLWSTISLIYLLLVKLCKNEKVQITILSIVLVSVVIYNAIGFVQILSFASDKFPGLAVSLIKKLL